MFFHKTHAILFCILYIAYLKHIYLEIVNLNKIKFDKNILTYFFVKQCACKIDHCMHYTACIAMQDTVVVTLLIIILSQEKTEIHVLPVLTLTLNLQMTLIINIIILA